MQLPDQLPDQQPDNAGPANWPGAGKRRKVKQLCAAYNREDGPDARRRLLEQLLGQPTDAHFEPPFYCDVGTNITLGRHCFGNHNVVILDCAPVTLGNNVLIGPNTVITAAGHLIDPVAVRQDRRHHWRHRRHRVPDQSV